MSKFYGNQIDNIETRYLLEATPFRKNTRVNFLGNLTPEMFFKDFYVSSIDKSENSSDREVKLFNDEIDALLNTTLKNKFAKVDMVHISGYGGCGKTTFVRYILWEKYKNNESKYIIDFEGEKSIEETYVHILAKNIFDNLNSIENNCNLISSQNYKKLANFLLKKFDGIYDLINDFMESLFSFEQSSNNVSFEDIVTLLYNKKDSYGKMFVSFLLNFHFLLLLVHQVLLDNKNMLIVFDNVDSIDNIEEEKKFVIQLKEFITNCNIFFGENLHNENIFFGKKVSELVKDFKIICFLTTRVITFNKFLELVPDMEEMYGWYSYTIPENYYNQVEIINKKVEYYLKQENYAKTHKLNELCEIRDFAQVAYKASIFKKLFNGNIRFCIKTLCYANNLFRYSKLLKESEDLFNIDSRISKDGATGIILSLLLNYFKEQKIYSDKLHLSECLPNNRISLSRVVLTIIKEKGGKCSIVDLFDCLSPFFDIHEISSTIYDLSEARRDIWRRLLIFSRGHKKTLDEIYEQARLYQIGERRNDCFSEVQMCISGEAYLDIVVPHFEFMLSRHRYEYDFIRNQNYHPLFSRSSEDLIEKGLNNDIKYRFERKIDWVFEDVRDCCKNSRYFANQVMKYKDWNENDYIYCSYYNYRSRHFDNNKQSYASRLIFSHIGYIERYRRYLLTKFKNDNKEKLRDINRRLVFRIKRYLMLYLNPVAEDYQCICTERQNIAAEILKDSIETIEKSKYYDFDTLIGF